MSSADQQQQLMDLAGGNAGQWSSLLVSLSETWKNDPRAVWSSFAMIIASEIGDKTFLIAAILSMRQPRLTVFLGGFSALALMSILSSFLGATFPSLLPKALTTFSAAILFFVFGLKMLKEAKEMTGEEMNEEMEEARKEVEDESNNWINGGNQDEMELRNVEEGNSGQYPEINLYPKSPNINLNRDNDIVFDRDESNINASTSSNPNTTVNISNGDSNPDQSKTSQTNRSNNNSSPSSVSNTASHLKEGARNLCGLCFSPVFAQAFVLTFLGEWGDRSQIATIALAAAHNVVLVSLGTIAGHGICTGLAVLGGSALAARISVKHVTFGGSILFLLFGVLYLFESISEYNISSTNSVLPDLNLENSISSDPAIPSPVQEILAKLGAADVGIGAVDPQTTQTLVEDQVQGLALVPDIRR